MDAVNVMMEPGQPPRFHPGHLEPPEPREPRRRPIPPTVPRSPVRPARPAPYYAPISPFTDSSHLKFSTKRWCILPQHILRSVPCSSPIECASSFIHGMQTLEFIMAYSKWPKKFKFSVRMKPNYFHWTPPLLKSLHELLYKNVSVRRRMRTLLAIWLKKRKFKPANADDIATLEPPVRPVVIYDWKTRNTYVFEAKTILKDCIERLLLHDELWVNPQPLRNPLTNLPLTFGQTHHLYEQLRSYRGATHWTLEAFRSLSYNLNRFITEYSTPLKYSAIRATFQHGPTEEYMGAMLEFIEKEHMHFGQRFNRGLYEWALRHMDGCPIIERWKYACRLNCELEVCTSDINELHERQGRLINPLTEELCGPPTVLACAKNMWHKEQLLKAGCPAPVPRQ